MQTETIGKQINILTGVVSLAVVLIGAFLAYLRIWQASAITKAVTASQEKIEAKITEATKELKQELARKDMVDMKFNEMDRRLTKAETWREAAKMSGKGEG